MNFVDFLVGPGTAVNGGSGCYLTCTTGVVVDIIFILQNLK